MKLQTRRKNSGGHTKTIVFVCLVIAAFILPFFFMGGKYALFSGGFAASGTSSKSATSGKVGEIIEDTLNLGYQLIHIEREVDEKLKRVDYVKIEDIAPAFKDAIVAIEDNRFYNHGGIDAAGVFRATLVNLQSGDVVEGGSTITQQLAKNLFLSPERSWERKFKELILAVRLEYNYAKDDILEMYLNSIYFGSNAYGIKKAAAIYFDKEPAALNLAESALLAGLPNAPSLNSPYVNPNAARKRQGLVLDAMVRYQYIEAEQAREAKNQPLKFAR